MSEILPIPQPSALNDAKGQTTSHGYRWFESLDKTIRTLNSAYATAANYWANTAGNLGLTPNAVWTAAAYTALTDAATITVDMSLGFNFSVTISGNRTLGNPSNAKVGQSGCFKVTASGGTRTIDAAANYLATSVSLPISIATGQICYIFYFVDTSSRIIVTASMNNPT